nr:tryptophan synthase subunit alpha [Verrucomicrobiota bacterium]
QTSVAESLGEHVARIRECTDLPIAVGFGVSTPEQVAEVARHGDAVVVGSAIVNQIAQIGDRTDLAQKIRGFVAPLAHATNL